MLKNETNNEINISKLYEQRLKILDDVLKDNSFSIRGILKDENKLILIKETFECVYKCFVSILEEMVKIYNNLLYSEIEPFVDGNKNIYL